MNLSKAMHAFFLQCGLEKTYWIGFSGGLDSTVLLSICAEVNKITPVKLRAIHVNHGLSANAAQWAEHCARIASQLNVEYWQENITFNLKPGDSLEEVARDKRYGIFTNYVKEKDVLLTAHHEDDQAETFILQLLRGAGTKGLSAMPALKPFAKGLHARPLLDFSRDELLKYAKEFALVWIDDESNENLKLTRNFIRHQFLTPLKKRFPSVEKTLARSARHCGETESLLAMFAEEKLIQCKGSTSGTLSVSKLLQLNEAMQRLILRQWIYSMGYPLPNTKKINTILKQVFSAEWDRIPCVKWGKVELKRYRDELFLFPSFSKIEMKSFTWDLSQPFYLDDVGYLYAERCDGNGLHIQSEDQLTIRFRQGGETIRLAKRGTKTLKNLFHEWNVLPWQRDRIPLIYINDELAAIPGYCVAENFSAKATEIGYVFRWEPSITGNQSRSYFETTLRVSSVRMD